MVHQRARIVLAIIVVTAACATRRNDYRQPASIDHDVLTRAEVARVVGTTHNAYSAVERLRPLFLRTRPGFGTSDQVAPHLYVFINGNFAGDVEVLKTIPLADVESIRRVQATTAFTQYGEIRSGDGVVMVRLRR